MSQTRTADVFLDEGVVVARIFADTDQDISDAEANLAACVLAAGGTLRPLLVDIRVARPIRAEVRHLYTGRKLVESFTAMALLVDASPLGATMGNLYLRIARPGVRAQVFTKEAAARAWLEDR